MGLAERFFNLYQGLDRARGNNKTTAVVNSKGKRESFNKTLYETYDSACWVKHINGTEGLGVIPINDDGNCVWGVIDIDEYPLDIIGLEEKIRGLGLPIVVLRTKSGGAHLTAFWKTWQPCSDVRAKMADLCFALDLGDREIYPKQVRLANKNDVGNWLNMPYFDGENTERYAIKDGIRLTPEQFLDYAESLRLDSVNSLVIPVSSSEISDGPPCLQTQIRNKVKTGERNNVLFNIGIYCRVKYSESSINWEDKLDEFNHKYIVPPLNHREVAAIVKSLEKKDYSYTCNNVPLCNHCNRESCRSKEFGVHAFQHIDIGVVLDSITKMNSQPPIWIMSIEGVRTEVETDDFLRQDRFRRICVDAINKVPGRMKAEDWDKFIRIKLGDLEIVDMPRETRISDRIEDFLPRYFGTTPKAKTFMEVKLGRWYEKDNRYLFRGMDFINYLERQNMKFDPRKIWVVLSNCGVSVVREHGEDLWCVSSSIYDAGSKQLKYELPGKDSVNENF